MTYRLAKCKSIGSIRVAWIGVAFSIAFLVGGLMVGCVSGGVGGSSSSRVVSPDEASELINSEEVVILDVRSQEEYETSHIADAYLLPYNEITEASVLAAAPDKDALVLVYCLSGVRSAIAADILVSLGYTNVVDLEGGIANWSYGVV